MINLTIKFVSYPKPIHFRGTIREDISKDNFVTLEERDGNLRAINCNLAEWWTIKQIPLEEQLS